MNPACNRCGGEGFIVVCVDDMCRGCGHCIHGDGEEVCPDCFGDMCLDDDDYPDDDEGADHDGQR